MMSPDKIEAEGKQDLEEVQTAVYQNGHDAGISASRVTPEVLLRRLGKDLLSDTQISELRANYMFDKRIHGFPPELLEEQSQNIDDLDTFYMGGYFAGLSEFLEKNRRSFKTEEYESPKPEILRSDYGLRGFDSGLRRIVPVSQPDGTESQGRYLFEKNGYKLGFAVGIVGKFGIPVDYNEVPDDSETYNAFRDGNWGVGRYSKQRDGLIEPGKKEKVERVYKLGLRTWLKAQGIAGIEVSEIDSPNKLKAFQAGMNGKSVNDSEVRKLLVGGEVEISIEELEALEQDIGAGRLDRFKRIIFPSEAENTSRSDVCLGDSIREQALRAYGKGQYVREQKEAARVKIRVFPPQSPS